MALDSNFSFTQWIFVGARRRRFRIDSPASAIRRPGSGIRAGRGRRNAQARISAASRRDLPCRESCKGRTCPGRDDRPRQHLGLVFRARRPDRAQQRGRAGARRRLDDRHRSPARRGRSKCDVAVAARPARTGGLRAGPADRRLQRRRTPSNPGWRDVCCRPTICRAACKLVLTQEVDGADDRRAPQQRVAGRQHAAAGQLHPLQPRAYRDHRSGGSQQDLLRMLRDRSRRSTIGCCAPAASPRKLPRGRAGSSSR